MEKKKKWIKGAVEHGKGAFKEKAEHAGKSTREFAKEHEHSGGKLGKEARLAETLMNMHKKKRPTTRGMMKNMYGKEK